MPSEQLLLPCPFCGGTVESVRDFKHNDYSVACTRGKTCYVQPRTPNYKTRADAIAAWNQRTALPAPAVATEGEAKRIFEDKLLGFREPWRIHLCEGCHKQAVRDDFVICSSVLPAAALSPSGAADEMIRSAAIRKEGVVYVCWAHTYPEIKRMNHDAPDDVFHGNYEAK